MTLKNRMQERNQKFITFADDNPAYYPVLNEEPKYLFSYMEVSGILKKLKNKTAGLDNIPMVLLNNLPICIIREYIILFNNAINHIYYSGRWKTEKVLPISKEDKNSEWP